MPVLENARHEKFAREVAKGKPQYKAYLAAGYEASKPKIAWSNASRLMASEKVETRVNELQEQAAKRHNVTVDWLVEKLVHAYEVGEKLGQTATLVGAVKEIGTVTGIRVERKEGGKPGAFAKLEDMSQAELIAIIEQAALRDSEEDQREAG